MTREELDAVIKSVKKRTQRRAKITLAAALITVFGGSAVLDLGLDLDWDTRQYYSNYILAVMLAICGIGCWRVATRAKPDCEELGAICPSCGKTLFSSRGNPLLFGGLCPHCGYQLIDDERAKEHPLAEKGSMGWKSARMILTPIVTVSFVYWVMWMMGWWP